MMFKYLKSKAVRESEEFRPDAIMLEAAGPGVSTHSVWVILLVLLIIGIIYATFSKVDKIVAADGRIVTTRQNITIKPLELSIIKAVHVLPGQRVSAGQVLFTFDVTGNRANLLRLQEQRESLRAQLDRLTAEKNNEVYNPPATAGSDTRLQKLIFESRTLYYKEKLNSYTQSIERLKSTIDSMEKSMVKYNERQDALKKIETMMSGLHERQASSYKELLQTQIQVIGMAIQLDEQTTQLNEYRHQLQAQVSERSTFETDWRRTLIEELVKVERDLLSIEKEVPKAEMLIANSEMRAPCDAVVHEIAPFQEGSAVREAEALITLVPVNVQLEAEIDIPAKDVGLLKIGDMGRLKFDAYPFQQYGTLDGKLRYISQDAFTRAPAESMQSSDGQPTYYRGRMTVSGRFKNMENVPLIPGMRLRAEIKVGERTIMSYLLYPFIKAMDESLREP